MSRIRPFRPGDEAALAEVCVRTAWAGADGTGRYSDDAIWPEIFVLPYVARHPDLAFVVETGDGRVAGYIVGASDTRAFEAWFREEWWPPRAVRWQHPGPDDTSAEAGTLRYAAARGGEEDPVWAQYPAHLHIDLLPELQGEGWGRRLIDTLVEALRAEGVTGLHLVASADNAGALAFYPRVGFHPLPSPEGVQVFGRAL
ncbi:GNAT family N-acetyltransferase [Microbacterium sp. P05]|uniref:GNAT family N-acetyltransferase n=1 Tax=Microbacterium sp. P05 TaxID=3366948 RepID=UPI003746CEFC